MTPTNRSVPAEAEDDRTACWCGGGRLRRVRLGGVDYLACDACGGELGDPVAGTAP